MAQNTFALMTNLGRAKEAAAIANGTAVVVTHIAIGDGATIPSGGETALYNEVARKAVSGHGTVVGASNIAYFDIFLEATEGPYTIREAGLVDQDGDLIAIARYDPPISKPIPSSGQTVEGTIRLEIAFSNIAAITVVVDPSFKVALQRLNRLPWLPVLSLDLTAPPAIPAVGDVYLVAAGATGAWTGQDGRIAEYTSAGWGVITPPDGHGISLPDGRIFEKIGETYVEKIAIDVQSGKWNYAAATGTANALTVTLDPPLSAHVIGMPIRIKIAAANTGPVTLNAGPGALPVVTQRGQQMAMGDLAQDAVVSLVCVGWAWMQTGPTYSEVPIIGSPTIYVRPDGNDANDGLDNTADRAKLTIGAAVEASRRYYAIGGNVLIKLGMPGEYAAPGNLAAYAGAIEIRGNRLDASAYKIVGSSVPTGSVGLLACSYGRMVFTGVRVINTGADYSCIGAVGGGSVTIDNCETSMTVPSAQAHINAASGGNIQVLGALHEGWAGYCWLADAGGAITQAGPITVDTAQYSIATVSASGTGKILRTGGTWNGAAVGVRYAAVMNGVINTLYAGENFYPGNAAGTASSGGQYV